MCCPLGLLTRNNEINKSSISKPHCNNLEMRQVVCAALSSASLFEFNQCTQFIRQHIDFQPQRHENKMYLQGTKNNCMLMILYRCWIMAAGFSIVSMWELSLNQKLRIKYHYWYWGMALALAWPLTSLCKTRRLNLFICFSHIFKSLSVLWISKGFHVSYKKRCSFIEPISCMEIHSVCLQFISSFISSLYHCN